MENKKENQNTSFGNLKFLTQLIAGNQINQMITNIKKAKQSLETYYKNIKDKVVVESKKPQVEIIKEESVIKPKVQKPIEKDNRENSFVKNSNVKKDFERNSGNVKNSQSKTPFNKENNSNFVKQSNRPFNKDDNKSGSKNDKSFNKKPLNIMADIPVIQKNDRNFGNKNKTHNNHASGCPRLTEHCPYNSKSQNHGRACIVLC